MQAAQLSATIAAPAAPHTSPGLPLAGRTVAVVHAAWHSCGSYQVNVSQAAAYKAMGAHVISWALMDWPPGSPDLASPRWAEYIAKTPDMPADERFYSRPPLADVASWGFMRNVYWKLIHGDHAGSMTGLMGRAPVPNGLKGRTIDLVHCNHFFCLPAVDNLLAGQACPVIVETQDIQARQYMLRNEGLFLIPPRATYDAMLATELDWLARADLLVHLNEEEDRTLRQLLPGTAQSLVYPAVAEAPTGPGGDSLLLVASANYPNYLSVVWLLEEVLPLAGSLPLTIAGNVDAEIRKRKPELYALHKALFAGRVDDIGALYANAKAVLLPTTEGHGLSIKAVEALSSGTRLIATTHAFRGMNIDPAQLGNVVLRDDATSFAQALRDAATGVLPGLDGPARATSDTRRAYDQHFSQSAYRDALGAVALPLMAAARA